MKAICLQGENPSKYSAVETIPHSNIFVGSLTDPRCRQASTLAVLTPIVVSHSNVVTNHVSHCSGQQVWLIHIDIHTDADGTGCADGLRDSHAGLTTRKGFPAV